MQMLLTDVDGLHWFDLFHIHPCYVGRLGTARETASCSLKLKSGFSLCVATGTDRNNHFHLSPQMPPYTYAKNIQKLSWNIQKGFKRPRTALQPEQHDAFALTGLQHTPNSSGLRLPVKHLCDLSGQKKSIKSIMARTLSHQIKTLASTMSTWNWL